MAAETDAMFAALAEHIGAPEMVADERFATGAQRKVHESALNETLGRWFAPRCADKEADALAAGGVCAAKCEPFKPIYANSTPQFDARGFLAPVTHPESGTHLLPVLPWLMANTPRVKARHAPRFGEHSRQVFAEELGVGDDEYEELVRLEVTGTRRVG